MVLCSDNIGNIGDHGGGACFSIGGGGQGGISGSYVFICGSLIDKSKPIASV